MMKACGECVICTAVSLCIFDNSSKIHLSYGFMFDILLLRVSTPIEGELSVTHVTLQNDDKML